VPGNRNCEIRPAGLSQFEIGRHHPFRLGDWRQLEFPGDDN
jgi:hypothetical protein